MAQVSKLFRDISSKLISSLDPILPVVQAYQGRLEYHQRAGCEQAQDPELELNPLKSPESHYQTGYSEDTILQG